MKYFLLFLVLVGGVQAAANAAAPALIVVLLPGTGLQGWQSADAPNLHHLMQTGALAVMNTRTAHVPGQRGRETPQSALLTLGAGARATGANASPSGFLPASSQAPGMNVTDGALFERRTGLRPSAQQSVCLSWPSILQANQNPGYDLRLGSLADTLAAHGIKVAAGGGPDADWIAAGNDGTVRRAAKLQVMPGLCLIWDAGPNIASADKVIGLAAAQAVSQKGRLLVLSPYAGGSDYQRNARLTPILLWGSGIPAGLIDSASTRRSGLVTNTDFAPSIADEFGIKRTELHPLPFGFAWSAQAKVGNVRAVEALNRQSVHQAQGMGLLPYLAGALGIWISVVTLLAYRRQINGFWTLAPIAALTAVLFAFSASSFWLILPVPIALVLIVACILGADRALAILTGGITAALTLDMVTGNQLMRRGLLGYSAIEGARYYGIGNEAMGLLLGSALTVSAYVWPRQRTWQFVVIGLLAVLVLLLGSAGAKAGGVLVSLAAFGTFLHAASGHQWTLRTVAALGAVIVAGMAATALGDAFLFPGRHSHIGEAVQRIVSGGPGEALDIVRRKLAVEGRLAYHSAWAMLLWAGLFCTISLWKRTTPKNQITLALRTAGMVGVAACLLLNDAGVVAAAIFVVTLWSEAAMHKQSLPLSG